LEKIKDWIIHKIKFFRRRLSKVISPEDKNLIPLAEEEEEQKPNVVL
jgi:hypothetical protein